MAPASIGIGPARVQERSALSFIFASVPPVSRASPPSRRACVEQSIRSPDALHTSGSAFRRSNLGGCERYGSKAKYAI